MKMGGSGGERERLGFSVSGSYCEYYIITIKFKSKLFIF